MSETFPCRIITPESMLLEEDVESLVLPGVEGKFGVLVGHTPYLARLDIGEIKAELSSGLRYVACSGGFAEVTEQGVKVLAATAELPEEIDVERARSALERAEKKLGQDLEPQTRATYESARRRAETRLAVAESQS